MSSTSVEVPQPHPITVQEYFRMGETGVLDPEDGAYTTRFRVQDLAHVGIAALPGIDLDLRSLF